MRVDRGGRILEGSQADAARFPLTYTWTELLINYARGFVRGGLLGAIAYRLDPWIPTNQFLVATVLFLYLVIIAAVICRCPPDEASPTLPSSSAWRGCCSPFKIPWPTAKEVAIVAAFFLTISVARRSRRVLPWLILTLLTYLAAGLIMEAAFFYLPAAVAYFLVRRDRELTRRDYGVAAVATAGLTACWFGAVNLLQGRGDVAQIVGSWRQLYAHAYDAPGALVPFNHSVPDLFRSMLHHQSSALTSGTYLLGFVLGMVPCALLWRTRDLSQLSRAGKQALAVACLVMFVPFGLAADWGRFIHLFVVHAFVLLAVVPERRTAGIEIGRQRWMPITALLLIIYGSSWTLQHFAPRGATALRRGVIPQLFG